ncbi:hypothetical protein FQR65_LT20841 [Abscondita terminalis]|nr:hypothetical protein FQR65_LT20841 [Abscondita terminalis]
MRRRCPASQADARGDRRREHSFTPLPSSMPSETRPDLGSLDQERVIDGRSPHAQLPCCRGQARRMTKNAGGQILAATSPPGQDQQYSTPLLATDSLITTPGQLHQRSPRQPARARARPERAADGPPGHGGRPAITSGRTTSVTIRRLLPCATAHRSARRRHRDRAQTSRTKLGLGGTARGRHRDFEPLNHAALVARRADVVIAGDNKIYWDY